MDDLIIKVLGGTASRFEEERLKRWREEEPENDGYFQDMARVWSLTSPEPYQAASEPPSVEEILGVAPIPGTPGHAKRAGLPSFRKRSVMTWGLLAASVAAVALGVRFIPADGPASLAIHRTEPGVNPTITLSDGSFARLAAGSSLQEWEVEGRREVSLEGRGFFAVARDETRPFVIRAGGGEVRVLGTRFQVDTEGDQVETVVVDGLVRVSNDQGSVEAGPGTMALMGPGTAPVVREVQDVFAFLSWDAGTMVFQATPLAQVAREVSRHFGRTLAIEGPDLQGRRVTAWFQGESFEDVAGSLCMVTEAVCSPAGDGVIMQARNNGGTR